MDVPTHLAIIPDGNRRWAEENDQPHRKGHQEGREVVRNINDYCYQQEIEYLTLFVFSTENWKRDKKEIKYLMQLFRATFQEEYVQELNEKNIRFNMIGRKDELPDDIQEMIEEITDRTKDNSGMVFSIAFNYGGQLEILEAINNLTSKEKNNKITKEEFESKLWSGDLPDVDLLIRTGKEKRISNFLLWKLAYSELFFSDSYWPDFDEKELETILQEYNNRKRRFGQ